MTRFRSLLLFLVLLSLPALACETLSSSSATATPLPPSPTPLATETPSPTPTPDATANFIDYENAALGLAFGYPADWVIEEDSDVIVIVSTSDLLDADILLEGTAGTVIATGPSAEFGDGELLDVVNGVLGDLPFAEEPVFTNGPEEVTINGQPAVRATVEGIEEEGGEPLQAHITLLRGADRAAIAVGLVYAADAEQFEPVLNAISDTLVLSEPVGPPLPDPSGELEFGETVSGSVPDDGASAWTFIGVEGEAVDITVDPVNDSLDAIVDVLDASGQSILESEVDEAFGTEEILDLVLPASDQYMILIRGFDGSGGDYQLSLMEAGMSAQANAIELGETISGSLAGDELDDYTFSSESGLPVSIVVEPEDNLDVVIEILDEDGILATEDSSYGREQFTFTPDVGAPYTIRVRGFAGSSGDYTIVLSEGSGEGPGVTIVASYSLDEGDTEGDAYPFTADEGSTVNAIVDPAGDLDVVVEIWDDDSNEIIETVDLSFGQEDVSFEVPASGNYFFNVLGYEGQGGDYTITLSGSPTTIFELASGDDISGIIGDEGYVDFYIRLDASETIILQVESNSDMDAVLELLDLDDNVLADVDDTLAGEGEELSFTAPGDTDEGTSFVIRVSSFSGEPGGVFTLEIIEG